MEQEYNTELTNKIKKDLEEIISARLLLQSTQRALWANYGVSRPILGYFKTRGFLDKYDSFTHNQKKSFLITLAGALNWKRAEKLFEDYSK